MSERILVVCPKAVGPAWIGQARIVASGGYELRRHQRVAVDNLNEKPSHYVNHGMGCGKTITFLESCSLRGRTFQIVDLTHASPAKKKAVLNAMQDSVAMPRIVVMTYEATITKTCKDLLKAVPWNCICCDEAHRLKSAGGKASQFLGRLAKNVHRRVCLSGTPMPNSPLDLYGQLRFLGALTGNWGAFRGRYAKCHPDYPSMVLEYQNLDELGEKFDAISSKAESADVLDLPEVVHVPVPVGLTGGTRRVYDELERDFVAELEDGTKIAVDNALTKLLRLQQLTGGWLADQKVGSEKSEAIKAIVDDTDEPLVVFCRFRADLNAVAEAAAGDYLELSGERKELERWQSGERRVLGVQISCGGAGIDLTRARRAVYYSVGYSLGDYEQSMARLHRPGAKGTVFFHHLVAEKSVDEKVYRALKSKKSVVTEVLNEYSSSEDYV